jgi:hypothetical protein
MTRLLDQYTWREDILRPQLRVKLLLKFLLLRYVLAIPVLCELPRDPLPMLVSSYKPFISIFQPGALGSWCVGRPSEWRGL